MELPLLKQAPTALLKSKPFQTDQFLPRKCRFPIKPESNYLGLASDQKGLLSSIVFKTLRAGRIMIRHRRRRHAEPQRPRQRMPTGRHPAMAGAWGVLGSGGARRGSSGGSAPTAARCSPCCGEGRITGSRAALPDGSPPAAAPPGAGSHSAPRGSVGRAGGRWGPRRGWVSLSAPAPGRGAPALQTPPSARQLGSSCWLPQFPHL